MLDTMTLRIIFCVLAFTLLALLYLVLYRRTRARYAGWWCLSLLLFMGGNLMYLGEDTRWQWLCEPLGNTIVVSGALTVWCGTCSLRDRRPPLWQLAIAPVVVAVATSVGHPGSDTWAGGPFFLLGMAACFGLGTGETWRLYREEPSGPERDSVYRTLVLTMTLVFALLALFYLARCVALLADGEDSRFFTDWFGTVPTTVLQTILLVVVSFSMSALSAEQRVNELHTRATRDGLTGLLNRTEFFRQARERLDACGHGEHGCVLVMADLDFFKNINDTFGHSAGDRALRSFARACTGVLRSGDLVGRVGGEEFAILLPDTAPSDAERITHRISDRYRVAVPLDGVEATVSYGIAPLEYGLDLEAVMARADAALYRAKATGRDRAVHHRS